MSDKIVFTPVYGPKETIERQVKKAGYIYFTTDSGEIYLDKSNMERVKIGGSTSGASLFYTAQGTDANPIPVDDDHEGFYLLDPEDVDLNEGKIKENDLIIGADGAFYRVYEIKDNGIYRCTRMAISGGGGGGGAVYSDKAKLNKKDPESNYLINGKTASIQLYAVSGKDPIDGSQLDERLTVYWTLSEQAIDTGVVTQYAQGNFPILASSDESPIWETFEYGTKARFSAHNILKLYVKGSLSVASREITYEFFTSELELSPHPNFGSINTYSPSSVTIYCNTKGSLDKIIYYYFETNGVETCLNPRGTVIGPGTSEQSITVPSELATHGAHKVRIELYQYINGRADMTSAATPIEMEIGVVDPESQKAVIWLGEYQDEYYQYDSIKIPFRVYDPTAVMGATITLFKDSNKIGTRTITDTQAFSIWEIVDADLDMPNYYTISCGEEDNEARREISFRLVEDPTRAGMKITTSGLRYLFDASGRSNSESGTNRAKYSYTDKNNNTIEATFTNFNWYNNGWVTDRETGNTCLRISNGATFRIPLKKTQFASSSASDQSHTFEFQFKVRNVQDYSNIVHNVTRYKGNTDERYDTYPNWVDDEVYQTFTNKTYLQEPWSNGKEYDNYDAFLQWYLPAHKEAYPDSTWPPSYDDIEYRKTDKLLNTAYAAGKYFDGQHGICIGAQDALFTNGVDTVNVSYVEDKIINLSVVYSHGNGESDGNNKLMSIYLNGMLTGVARSTLGEAWSIGNDDTMEIVFNSQYCDFDLYKIRVYNQPLTLPAVLTNYTVDLKDPVAYDLTQLAVVNNTIGESQLVYDEMLNYNANHPDGYIMPYLVFTTKYANDNVLPYSKSRKIKDVQMEFVNTGLERAYTTGELGELAERAGQTVEEYYMHHCPSWKGDNITLQVQGTSSEFYPRRNYKAKTKDDNGNINMYMNRGPFAQKYLDPEQLEDTHLKFFYYDNNTVGTTKFTLKIDYMESSGTYNMGFANLVKNAYTHHPLYDYYTKGAIQTASTEYTQANAYEEGVTYWYKNHKGSWKNTVDDELKITSAADFNMGPVAFADSIGQTKVCKDESVAEYNKWYTASTVYSDAPVPSYLDDYRTSVQGFPVLAFHQTTDANGNSTGIKFIGRYNMLLDKGSDEAYGFKPVDDIYQKFVQKKGKPVAVKKVAECWEAENNSRGFCSFRDASTNRTDDKFFDTGKLTAAGAPIVADYWEYRYNAKADSLDVIYDLNKQLSDEGAIATVLDELGVDLRDNTAAVCPDSSYVGDYTVGMQAAGEAMLDVYSNWERAVRWVYSTDQDAVPSMGVYSEIDLGQEVYAPDTYYVLDNNSEYVLDSAGYDNSKIYYKLVNNAYEPIKLCASNELIYQPNTYYILTTLGDYVLDPETEFNTEYTYYNLIADEANSGAAPLPAPVVYNGHTYNYDTKEYRNAKFTNDLTKHFNLEYLVTYFVMTEVFECYDSRGKNAMFGSWGPQEQGGDYIWYPMFYDIDTQLGINNTGIPSFEYYVDATENGTFSTNDSLLWNNLYKNFRSQIIQKYRQLRGKESTYPTLKHAPIQTVDRIEKWYLADPEICNSFSMRGERPLIAFNLDEYYKYISITNSLVGYQDRNGGIGHDNGTYFYALQGDRSLSRQQFLTNRFNYIDSWLNQGNYERGGTNIIRGRIAANSPSNTSDKWIEGTNKNTEPTLEVNSPYWTDATETVKTHMFDGEYWITMEPVRNSYVTVGTDAANFPSLKYTNLEGPVKFVTPDLENGVRTSGGYHEQLYYIYGLDQMKSLGDMSKLYWTEFNIEGSATKMTSLLLGYDGLDEQGNHYENSNINMYGIHASNSATDNGGMPLLKTVNLSYITFNDAAPTYNFASCEKLEDFRAIGSNITNVTFADGVALRTLYLPDTIKTLNLVEATKLNNIVTTLVERNDLQLTDVTPGLYIPGLTDRAANQAVSSIEQLSLIGDCLGYDSYKLLQNYYEARKAPGNTSKVTLTEVDWSPYKLIDEGTAYSQADSTNHLYWVDDGHYGFTEYVPTTENDWILKIKNGELYKLDSSLLTTSEIISDGNLFINLRDASNFFSTAETNNGVPIITGIVYINNDTEIDEQTIESDYVQAYPELKFFFKSVHKTPAARYIILNNDGTYDVLARKSLPVGGTFFPNPRTLISSAELDKYDTRASYDFYGWSDKPLSPAAVEALPTNWYEASMGNLIVTTNNPNSAALTEDQWYDNWSTQSLVEGQDDYIFYAVYGVHKYKMTYYNGNGEILETVLVPAGAPIVDNLPKKMATKEIDDSLENLYNVYKHIGWAFTEGAETPVEWTQSNLGNSQRDRRFYPVFALDSVYNNVINSNFLVELATYNGGALIGLAGGYEVTGKITLPKTFNGKPVTGIGIAGFANTPDLKMVFWEEGAAPAMLSMNAFHTSGLKYFEFVDTITRISQGAFQEVGRNGGGGLINRRLDVMSSLTHVDMNAFNHAFGASSEMGSVVYLPGSLQNVGQNGFRYNGQSAHGISGFVIGSETSKSQLNSIGNSAFVADSVDGYALTVYLDSGEDRTKQVWVDLANQAGSSINWA